MNHKIDFQTLCKLQYGMYIITTAHEGKFNGQIATVVSQITSKPIQIIICLSKNTLTHEMISHSGIFGISVLEQDTPMKFIGHFGFRSGRDFDKFADMNFEIGALGCPLVTDNTLVTLESKVNNAIDVGTHTLFTAELVNSSALKPGVAMTYEYYHAVKNGKSPENAPTFVCNVKK